MLNMIPKKWTAIAGSWKNINEQVESDVRRAVRKILSLGGGIVTGGALNVDYIVTDETLKLDPKAQSIRVFLPTTLEIYSAHYRRRAKEGVISEKQAENLIAQLESIKGVNPDAITENTENSVVNNEAYFQRITDIINAADSLFAFQVNKSPGTQNTIEKARQKGIPVTLFSYTIKG